MSTIVGSDRSDGRCTKRLPSITIAVVLLGSLLCIDRAPAAEGKPDQRPVLQVPPTETKPVIDGKLDEACWKDAAKTGPLKVAPGEPAKSTTEAFILRDADHLYVAVRFTPTGPAIEVLEPAKPKPSERRGERTETECLELFIDSNGDRNSYYQIRVIADRGTAGSSYNENTPPWNDRTWQPPFKCATAKDGGGWVAEFALPFDIFCKNKTLASEIGFNIIRSGMPGNEIHCWRGARTNPGEWGILTGIPARRDLPRPDYATRGLTRWYRPPNKEGRSFLADEEERTIELGPGSAHPGTTGEVTLELEGFLLAGDPHARGIIWDLAVDEKKGELYVLSDTRLARGVAEVRVFDRRGQYLRTIMPFNPTLPRSRVWDLCEKMAREGQAELVIPKLFEPWGELSPYGDWWHHPQKMALTPDGDLVLANIYKGILWRMKPDGSLPAEGWTSIYHRERNEPFESTVWTQESWHVPELKNYMPFHALHYPYFCFGPSGLLYVSAGQSSRPTKRYAYYFEVGEEDVTYHEELAGKEERGSLVWKCQVHSGVKLERRGCFGGFAQPSGLVLDANHLIVADAGNNRIQVLREDGSLAASLSHYEDKGQKKPLHGPTALAMDRDKNLYVLIGSRQRPEDQRVERTLRSVQRDVQDAARKSPEGHTRLIKLKSWRQPELLAASGPLHPDVLQIAVDAGVSPPLVWVANGDGPGGLLQLSGDDLSVKARWADSGEALSCPRQSGNQPILNIDPETGHLYVEDDSNYRLKQYGTVYRIDQQGKVLKTWAPLFFEDKGLRMTCPWAGPDFERHWRYPDEPLFIDSIFGKDGRVYRWKLGKAAIEILRFDRAGKPIPFKATGTNALSVDHAMQANFWHDVYRGVEVDRHGNVYYVAKGEGVKSWESRRYGRVDVYDADGNPQKKGLLSLECVRGIQVDDEGNLYAVHSAVKRPWEDYLALSKFRPSGGEPVWSRRWEGYLGVAELSNAPCHCVTSRHHQTLDGKGYLYAAGKHSVLVIDCNTGKLVGEFGSYGNMDCMGKGSGFPHPELPFGAISALSVWQDRLFAVDVVNRRVVKCRIVYRQAEKG